MIAEKEESHLLMDDLDIDWKVTNSERRKFRELWNDGASLNTIEDELKRSQIEVTLLVIEQAKLGHIEQRSHGVYGY